MPLLLGVIGSLIASLMFQWHLERVHWSTLRGGMDRELLTNRLVLRSRRTAELFNTPPTYLFRRDFYDTARSYPHRFASDPERESYERAYMLLDKIREVSIGEQSATTNAAIAKHLAELDAALSDLRLSLWQSQ